MTNLLLLSTCGTSTLSNDADPDIRRWLNDIANKPQLSDCEEGKLNQHVEDRKTRLLQADAAERRRLSAELNGIGAIFDKWNPQRLLHLLVHTDTAAGRASACIVKRVLEADDQLVQLLTASGLRTDDFPSFREALAELTQNVEEWFSSYRDQRWTTLFNLTGGFKSVNAYLQALGMLHADRCVFLFDGARQLMEIPRLPVKLVEADEVRTHLKLFRRLAVGYPVTANEASSAPDSLLMEINGKFATSVWGDVVWQRVRKTLLTEALFEPLSPKLVIKEKHKKKFQGLPEDRRIQVNEALDALSAHLDCKRDLPKSNSFKQLQGNPAPPSTHELYLWSDEGAWRLFGHYEASDFVADSLGPHL